MKYYDFEDLYIGLKEEFEVVLTDDKMQKFKDISGDENPLHTNEELALKKGMLGKVVYGMLTSSFYSTLVGVHLPGEKCLLQGIDIIFKKPVYLNEKLKVVGEIKYINEVYRSIEIRAYIKNEKNEKVSVAKIKVGVI
ncbi:MaoC/PaaZ C-terminal domain-containing protein [Fusobacterium polymorphum]|jgi:enoyl-coA hydratase, R-specific|uniref:MaoC/PaaZ C-terminal domain-containing protein n=1 Tax=Fusobacterium nucleatum subsp. polymorphum TaxID=76857 RepID=UPI002B4BC353|nr:MaoC/PaaZ C-terminal domain-containing protein [Fusobacterium polymorphum]WRL69981.1 MaoC/PaaZ C-terminal domain-containing protein [Fusobacterium polymorphum]